MIQLKPCPFCGMNACAWSKSRSWYVKCEGSACAAQTKPFCEREEAIEAWNTREELTCTNTASHFRDFECSECFDFWQGYEPNTFHYCPNCGAKVVE